jgi:pyruvate formate lyase activating enzyme
MNTEIKGYVHSLESFGSVDGPGVRYVVFLQGCTMRCKFCHNPETWAGKGEEWTAQDLFNKVKRYKNYWGKNGGITVSGGEPLLQMDFVTEFFKLAKAMGVHTTIDTAGQPFSDDPQWLEKFSELMAVTDLVLLDLKEMNEEGHKDLTGVGNSNILKMAQWLSDNGKHMWIRHVLVPNVTDDEKDLEEMSSFIASLKTVDRVEVLPYHTLGLFKWDNLGIEYPLKDVPAPTAAEIQKAEKILHTDEY